MSKQVSTAIISALVPGLGQFLLGERYRGSGILIGFLLILATTLWYGQPLWYLSPLSIWLWNVWDAFHLALGRRHSVLLPLAFGLAAAYGIGWQVVEIDFSRANMERAIAILRPMTRPDFIQPRRELNQMWVPVEVPCSSQPPAARRDEGGRAAFVMPDCGRVSETLIVSVSGLWPNTATDIYWQTPIGNSLMLGEGEITMLTLPTDENGALTTTIRVPTTALVAAPDPTLPQFHRVYFEQSRPIGGYELSFIGSEVLKGALATVSMALMATGLAVLFAVPLSFLAARNLMSGNPLTYAIYLIVRTLLNILRSIESLIIAIVFVVIVGLGPFAGMLALALHSVAALGKLYSEVIEGIDPGPIEAIRATGANWLQVVRYAVIPQIIPPFTAFTIYRWDINVRSATVIGLVGGGGIGFLLIELIRVNNMRGVSAVFIAIAAIVIVLDYFSAKLRERLV
ncbi:MAG: phosphonate ABC transporter, permease protein PhnE [Anaerolineales bacterium]|nr:phosphonate ABC transporter, permease protein PhnE [Anaerolineales bacterium]MDW8279122.1 phosphonate ABC transporter, permease protein PhnE [Anaerolineales bacterium]